MALYRAGDQFLIAALAVGVRAVEKIDADLARRAQSVYRRICVGLVVKRCHRRAAETDRGDLEPAETAPLHPFASSKTFPIDIVRGKTGTGTRAILT
jgi:hypothetical protein